MMKTSLGLKVLSPKIFMETVHKQKVKLEKLHADEAFAEQERRAASAALMKRGKQSPTQTKSDVDLLRELSRKDMDPLNLDGESSYFEGPGEGEEEDAMKPSG